MPQVRGMYHGDRSRKEVLVAYGFRLPSALDNRPLNFEEWEAARRAGACSCRATPGPYELQQVAAAWSSSRSSGRPGWSIRRSRSGRSRARSTICWRRSATRAARNERVLVTTLTKRMAEDLTQYYQELGVKVRYLHSDIDTLERVEILRDLRRGDVRRAGRHQPAARGAGPAGSVAGGDSRRRQGRVPAVGAAR